MQAQHSYRTKQKKIWGCYIFTIVHVLLLPYLNFACEAFVSGPNHVELWCMKKNPTIYVILWSWIQLNAKSKHENLVIIQGYYNICGLCFMLGELKGVGGAC
jgi:hypothetical protein